METHEMIMLVVGFIVLALTIAFIATRGGGLSRYFLKLPAYAVLYYGGSN